jgi:two-component system, OmpR family, response regulator
MATAGSRQLTATSGNDAGLRGRLEQFGLATVLTFLDLERRSGELLVIADERVGRVWLRTGRVVAARIEGSRRVNRAAIYELLSWDRGRFAFTLREVPPSIDEVGAPTTMLLVEAARRADEAGISASP